MNTEPLCELIGDYTSYEAFIGEDNEDNCMEYEGFRKDDDWARGIMSKYLGIQSEVTIQQYGHHNRDAALRKLKDMGLTIRQIERLTGIGRGVVQKA